MTRRAHEGLRRETELVVVKGVMTSAPKLLFADSKGKVMEHPYLLATLRSGEELLPPQDKPIPLPAAGRLVHLPGRLPVGIHPETGELELVREMKVGGRQLCPTRWARCCRRATRAPSSRAR